MKLTEYCRCKNICKCGKKIEITVPMYTDIDDNFVCMNCYKKLKENPDIRKAFETLLKRYNVKIETSEFSGPYNEMRFIMKGKASNYNFYLELRKLLKVVINVVNPKGVDTENDK